MLTHKGTQTIKTQRLVLRKFTPEDAQPMFETWADDERVTRYLTWQPHGTVDITKTIVNNWCSSYKNDNSYNWAIEFNDQIIGSISVVSIDENSEHMEIGYCIGFDFWNKGIMHEVCRAVIDFLFNEVGVNRIEIAHAVNNPASGRVAQKCGLTYEGTKRQFFKSADGKLQDIAFYSILKSEYFSK